LIVPKYLSFHTSLQKPALNQNQTKIGIPKMSLQPSTTLAEVWAEVW
jgi:hypothetical protein